VNQARRQVLDSPAFKRMVVKQWTVSVVLTTALFAIYYGVIVLVAFDKPLLAQKVGGETTIGILLAVAVIVLAWMLTAVYVAWANSVHDPRVRDLKRQAG